MAYSYEGVSTHPKLRKKPETKVSYIDRYGPECTGMEHEEGWEKAFGLIKNRKALPISSSEQWSIGSITSQLESEK